MRGLCAGTTSHKEPLEVWRLDAFSSGRRMNIPIGIDLAEIPLR
jgi:hypothetical protein